MKYLIISGVFILGLSLGYVVGTQMADKPIQQNFVSNSDQIENNQNNSQDHDKHNNGHHNNANDVEDYSDTLEFYESDSTLMELNYTDTLAEDDLSISREKMIKSVKLPIVFLGEEVAAKDTAIKEMLGIDEMVAKSLFVEFWESPLNFEGYKLSKKKLIVYGLSPQFNYKIYRNDNNYYFAYQNVYYKMKETQDFLPFLEVAKSEVFNDWFL